MDEPIAFIGGGCSPDGGICRAEDVTWHSSVQGLIGSGLHVVRDDLRPGAHRVSVTLPDGSGGEARAQVWIRISDSSRRPFVM